MILVGSLRATVLVSLGLLAGCGGSSGGDGNAPAGGDAGNDVATDVSADSASDGGSDANADDGATPDASDAAGDAATDAGDDSAFDGATGDAGNACGERGGICVGVMSDCTGGGGTAIAAGASGCVFSDGPGVCCAPPAMASSGSTCASYGGVCGPIAGCNFVNGAFAPEGCTGVNHICCVPSTICGEETQACCDSQTTFRPACNRGTWECTISGTTLKPIAQCP